MCPPSPSWNRATLATPSDTPSLRCAQGRCRTAPTRRQCERTGPVSRQGAAFPWPPIWPQGVVEGCGARRPRHPRHPDARDGARAARISTRSGAMGRNPCCTTDHERGQPKCFRSVVAARICSYSLGIGPAARLPVSECRTGRSRLCPPGSDAETSRGSQECSVD